MAARLKVKVAIVANARATGALIGNGLFAREGAKASDESRWITGVALPVDGGFLVMGPTTSVRLEQQKF